MDPKFLIIAPQGLGDALEATPFLSALSARYPGARIDVVVTRSGPAALFRGMPEFVNDVLYLPFWEKGPFAFVRSVMRERIGRRYDASFLAFPAARPVYRFLLGAFRSRRRYAHDWSFGYLDAFLQIQAVPVRKAHNVERNRDLLRAAGIEPTGETGYLTPASWKDSPVERGRRIAVHVGSIAHDGLSAKRWPVENFAAVCSQLRDQGFDVVLIAGPDELSETTACANLAGGIDVHQSDLVSTSKLLSRCAAVLANDNGIAHLAAGVGTPVVAIFGPTPTEFGPFSANAVSLRPSTCPPCFNVRRPVVTCAKNIDFACLKRDVTVELVLAEVKRCVSSQF